MPLPSTDERQTSAESYLQMGEAAVPAASVADHYREDTVDIAGTAVGIPSPGPVAAQLARHCCGDTADTVGTLSHCPAAVAAAIVVAYHTDRYPSCLPLANVLACY